MKVIVDGKEVESVSFANLKPGDVFRYANANYLLIKTASEQVFRTDTWTIENYNTCCQDIVFYPHAKLVVKSKVHTHEECGIYAEGTK